MAMFEYRSSTPNPHWSTGAVILASGETYALYELTGYKTTEAMGFRYVIAQFDTVVPIPMAAFNELQEAMSYFRTVQGKIWMILPLNGQPDQGYTTGKCIDLAEAMQWVKDMGDDPGDYAAFPLEDLWRKVDAMKSHTEANHE